MPVIWVDASLKVMQGTALQACLGARRLLLIKKKKKKNLLTCPSHLFPPLFRTCATKKTALPRLAPVPECAAVCANPRRLFTRHLSGACRTVVLQERPGKKQVDTNFTTKTLANRRVRDASTESQNHPKICTDWTHSVHQLDTIKWHFSRHQMQDTISKANVPNFVPIY